VKGEEFLMGIVVVEACPRGEGVSGMRPPAVRVEKSPLWDFFGVDTEILAIVKAGKQ
jgi:hypothetical protein